LALLLAHPVFAIGANEPRGELTLTQAVAATLARNPDLQASTYELRAAEARITQAGLRPVPELGLELENFAGSGAVRGTDALETTLTLSRVIELGGKRDARITTAGAARDLVNVERQTQQLDVLAEVARRFIRVASDQEQLRLARRATELARQTVAAVETRVKAARSPEVELYRARITLTQAEVEQQRGERELLSSRHKLAAMWGSSEDSFESVRADLYVLPETGEFAPLMARLEKNPDFLRFASEARLRDAEIRVAQTQRRRDITLGAGLRRLEETSDQALVASVSIPLFAPRRADAAVAEAEAFRGRVDSDRTAAMVRAQAQLFELYQELKHSVIEAQTLRTTVMPQLEEVLKQTEYAWQRGRYSYLEWVDAQREYVAVQRSLIEAAANAQLFQIEIERLTNAPLNLSAKP
jgi:cobalt-zinc-cadmium efflux system outer membrane protein